MMLRTVLSLLVLFIAAPMNAQFGPASVIDHGDEHRDVIATDLDGDTDLDLFFQKYGSFMWSRNEDGLGQFAPAITLEMQAGFWPGMRNAVGDVDGDADLDLVLYRPWSDDLVWRANDGIGNFGPGQLIASASNFTARNIACADVAGSTLPDVLVSDGGTVRWWVNDSGTFGTMDSLVHGEEYWSRIFRVADIDLDGDMDHLVISDSVYIGVNEGGSWSSTTWNTVDPSNYPYGQELIDVDADGDLDLVDAGWGVFWAESQMADNGTLGSVVHEVNWYAPSEGAGWSAALGCGAGASILWCDWIYTDPIRWTHFDDATNTFTAPAITSGLSPAGDGRLFFGDLNGDGRKDIVISRQDTLKWYANEMAGTGGSLATVPTVDTLCLADPYNLPEGTPAGGLWSGTAFTTGNDVFFPYAFGLGAGTYELHYGALDSMGCIASATVPIEVEDCLTTGTADPHSPLISVGPNPASDRTLICFPSSRPQQLRIVDVMGREVWHRERARSPVEVDLGGLAPGTYSVWIGDKQVRIVVSR